MWVGVGAGRRAVCMCGGEVEQRDEAAGSGTWRLMRDIKPLHEVSADSNSIRWPTIHRTHGLALGQGGAPLGLGPPT